MTILETSIKKKILKYYKKNVNQRTLNNISRVIEKY